MPGTLYLHITASILLAVRHTCVFCPPNSPSLVNGICGLSLPDILISVHDSAVLFFCAALKHQEP